MADTALEACVVYVCERGQNYARKCNVERDASNENSLKLSDPQRTYPGKSRPITDAAAAPLASALPALATALD
ncbi:hypothetical protein PENFLA_c001G03260 [Penicillium flavigenum]|uniref:Uncharacterized protein n=1 Tax=Penicillium flavigenum TaxID=254877 RepID=A0A1V6U398_9EURO|nr:hypothetical protein PENFLA_c001G03260 [Penicillium flavigenum]